MMRFFLKTGLEPMLINRIDCVNKVHNTEYADFMQLNLDQNKRKNNENTILLANSAHKWQITQMNLVQM